MNNSWKEMNFGSFPVTEIAHATLTLSDGINLGLKAWLPCKAHEISQKFPYFSNTDFLKWKNEIFNGTLTTKDNTVETNLPTILEYLPYSKDSAMTLSRDHNRHPWFCSYGYVILRVDIRGTGSSEGFYFEEYDEQEINDCIEVIEWISQQPWSNKKVGMYGKSWGGFNGLQVAYKQPEALKTVVTLYSTDNRYTDDMHYQGGTIIGNGMISWASFMFTINARPPHPRYFPSLDEWKTFWLTRLKTSGKSPLSSWLHHQHSTDPFWAHGSIYKDYNKVNCPVLVIGGLADPYVNAAFRMSTFLNKQSKGVIGPWSHEWPDTSLCGPNIDYTDMCLKWWDYHLKSDKTKSDVVSAWPRLSLFLRNGFKEDKITSSLQGNWVQIDDWDNAFNTYSKLTHQDLAHIEEKSTTMVLHFGPSLTLQNEPLTNFEVEKVELQPHALQGSDAGMWLTVNFGFPTNQSRANKHSMCWKSTKLDKCVNLAGLSKLFVGLSAKTPGKYSIQVRVCDQFPSGESTLVTKGCLNLSNSEDGWVVPYCGNKTIFCVPLNGTSYVFEPGHEIWISITPTYFPGIFPSIDNKGLFVHPEDTSFLFQTFNLQTSKTSKFPSPKPLLQLPIEQLSEKSSLLTTQQLEDGNFETRFRQDSGLVFYPSMDYEYQLLVDESFITNEEVSQVQMTAVRELVSNFKLTSGQKVTTRIETTQEMTACKQRFTVKEHLKVSMNDAVIFDEHWNDNIARKYV